MQQLHLHARFEFAVEYSDMCHDSLVGVEIGIEYESLGGWSPGRLWRGHSSDNCFEDLIDTDALFRTCWDGRISGDRQNVLQLLPGLRNIRMRQIDFVNDRDDREVLLHCQVNIGNGLSFYTLRGIDD